MIASPTLELTEIPIRALDQIRAAEAEMARRKLSALSQTQCDIYLGKPVALGLAPKNVLLFAQSGFGGAPKSRPELAQ